MSVSVNRLLDDSRERGNELVKRYSSDVAVGVIDRYRHGLEWGGVTNEAIDETAAARLLTGTTRRRRRAGTPHASRSFLLLLLLFFVIDGFAATAGARSGRGRIFRSRRCGGRRVREESLQCGQRQGQGMVWMEIERVVDGIRKRKCEKHRDGGGVLQRERKSRSAAAHAHIAKVELGLDDGDAGLDRLGNS